MGKFKITIDEDTCIGCSACVATCPEIFDMGDNGKAITKKKETDKPCAKESVAICPVEAITIK